MCKNRSFFSIEASNWVSWLSKVSINTSSRLWLTSSADRKLCRQYSCCSFGLPDRSSVVSWLRSQFRSMSSAQRVTSSDVRKLVAQYRYRSRVLARISSVVSRLLLTFSDSSAVKCSMPVRSAMFCPDRSSLVTAASSSADRLPSTPAPFRLAGFVSQARKFASGKFCALISRSAPAASTPAGSRVSASSAAASTAQRVLYRFLMGSFSFPCRVNDAKQPGRIGARAAQAHRSFYAPRPPFIAKGKIFHISLILCHIFKPCPWTIRP